jgi:hypothetical protein
MEGFRDFYSGCNETCYKTHKISSLFGEREIYEEDVLYDILLAEDVILHGDDYKGNIHGNVADEVYENVKDKVEDVVSWEMLWTIAEHLQDEFPEWRPKKRNKRK